MRNFSVGFSIFIVYVGMQVASVFLAPEIIVYFSGKGYDETLSIAHGFAWTLFLTQSFAALVVAVILNRRRIYLIAAFKGLPSSYFGIAFWSVVGFFLAMSGQFVAVAIESGFGVSPGSENTTALANIAKVSPVIIFVVILFAPFLEEAVFRRVIFGGLYYKTNFWIAAIVSASIFSAVHGELKHFLVYLLPGLAFSYVYARTKRLATPIISHMLVNTFVIATQLNAEKLQKYQEHFIHFLQ